MADDDDLGVGLADLGELARVPTRMTSRGLCDSTIRRLGVGWRLVDLHGGHDAAELDGDVGARHAPVGGGGLHGLGRLLVVAESVDVDARHEGHEALVAGQRSGAG